MYGTAVISALHSLMKKATPSPESQRLNVIPSPLIPWIPSFSGRGTETSPPMPVPLSACVSNSTTPASTPFDSPQATPVKSATTKSEAGTASTTPTRKERIAACRNHRRPQAKSTWKSGPSPSPRHTPQTSHYPPNSKLPPVCATVRIRNDVEKSCNGSRRSGYRG